MFMQFVNIIGNENIIIIINPIKLYHKYISHDILRFYTLYPSDLNMKASLQIIIFMTYICCEYKIYSDPFFHEGR